MIKAPSLQNPSSLIYSGDPALNLPPDDEQNAEERARLLRQARETGRWDDLLIAGQQPTVFNVKPLTGTEFDYWGGEVHRRQLAPREQAVLAVRLALRGVTNLGDCKVKLEKVDGHTMATTEIIDAIYAAAGSEGALVLLELAATIVERAKESPSPK